MIKVEKSKAKIICFFPAFWYTVIWQCDRNFVLLLAFQPISIYMYQGRHGEFEPGKVQYSTPNFFHLFFSYKSVLIETQNLGKDQTLAALAAVAALLCMVGIQERFVIKSGLQSVISKSVFRYRKVPFYPTDIDNVSFYG